MTLNLVYGSGLVVAMASDRLATVPGMPKHDDPLMNKNVIYAATDGIICFGLTGLAKLHGDWADDWIADVLYEDKQALRTGRRGRVGMMMGAHPPTFSVAEAIERIRAEAELAMAAEHPSLRSIPQEFPYCGWQIAEEESIPIIGCVTNNKGQPSFEAIPPAADWWRTQTLISMFPDYRAMFAAGYSDIDSATSGEEPSTDDLAMGLASTVRLVADQHPDRIGPDVMTVVLSPPDQGLVEVRFLPKKRQHATLQLGAGDTDVPAAFTPWYLGTGVVCGPRLVTGGLEAVPALPWQIITMSPTETGGIGLSGSVPRKGDPGVAPPTTAS